MIGSRVAEAHQKRKHFLLTPLPRGVTIGIFVVAALVGSGFFHFSRTPFGLFVCRKTSWGLSDTFDTRACLAPLAKAFEQR